MTLKCREFTSITEEFPSYERKRWEVRDYGILRNSHASPYLKRPLVERAKVRPRNFFGEAWIVTCLRLHVEGVYGSFKWLTADKWSQPRSWKPRSWYEEEYKTQLDKHVPFLPGLQSEARQMTIPGRGVSSDKKKRKKLSPSEPDLWLIDNEGRHHFIKAKIHPRDEATQQQVAGLALIARHFVEHGMSVSSEILTLYEKGTAPPSNKVEEQYCRWYNESR